MATKKKAAAPKKDSGKQKTTKGGAKVISTVADLEGLYSQYGTKEANERIDSGEFEIRGQARQHKGDTERRAREQVDPWLNTPEGQSTRWLGGGLGKDKLNDIRSFSQLGNVYFPDSAFDPMKYDPEGERLSGKFEGAMDKSLGAVDKGLGALDTQQQMLTPELAASLREVAKGAVNDPTLMAEGARARADSEAFLAQADKERQIDPAQQAVIDELWKRSQGFTPEEKAAYQGQIEIAIERERQKAARIAANAGARGIQGGLAADLGYKADQDAMMARSEGGQKMILTGRELGDKALTEAGTVTNTAVDQSGQRQAGFAKLGAGRQQDSGNILKDAVTTGQNLYDLNQRRVSNANTGLSNIAQNQAGMVNAGSGAMNAGANVINPYLDKRGAIDFYNSQLPLLKGQTRAGFTFGGLQYGTEKENADINRQYASDVLNTFGKIAGKETPAPTINNYLSSGPGSDKGATP